MKKTLLCALLLFLACVCLAPMGSAEQKGTCGDHAEWTLDDAGLLTISGTGDISHRFSALGGIRKIVIQNGVTGIGDWAFGDCAELTSVQIPNSVTFIGSCAFYNCVRLQSAAIPNSVTGIGDWAFGNCTGLTDVALPDSGVSIGEAAFYACAGLTEIRIPDSVAYVGQFAFSGCSAVPTASVGSSGAKALSKAGFHFREAGCPQVDLQYNEQDGAMTELSVVWADPSAVSLTIPRGVTRISDWVFAQNQSLTSVSLPDSLTSIGDAAFYLCGNLSSVRVPDGVTFVGGFAFSGAGAIPTASVGSSGAKALSQAGFPFRDARYPGINLQYLDAGDSVIHLAVTGADESVASVTVPQGVTMIGGWAFAQNPHLKSVSLPDGLIVLGDAAFYECENLSSISLPDSVVSIGSFAFCKCEKLSALTIPGGVASVGEHAFANCSARLSASIGSAGARALGQAGYSFRDAGYPQIDLKYLYQDGTPSGLAVTGADASAASVTVPQGVTSVEGWAFAQNPNLGSVSLPDGLKTIGDAAFYECANLSNISLPDSVVSIGSFAFCKCEKLSGFNIPGGVAWVGEHAFASCPAVRFASIGSEGAKTLSKAGFSFRDPKYPQIDLQYLYQGDTLTGLAIVGADASAESVTIPDSVTAIGDEAFKSCAGLPSLSIPDSVTSIGELAFPATVTLYVSENSYACEYALNHGIPYAVPGEEKPQPDTAKTVSEKVKEIVAEVIRPGMTDYQKALALHNYLVYHANYDYTYENGWADGVLLKGSGICQSYTDAYALLLDAVGIQNWKELGTDHIWNVAKLDGSWCHIDVTWDDPGTGGAEHCGFFAVTDYALEGVSSHERFNRNTVSDDYKISYAYKSGTLRSIVNEWKRQINEKLENEEYTLTIENSMSYPNGLNDRMAYQMLRDEKFFIGGREVRPELSFSSDFSTETYHLRVKFDPNATPSPTVLPGDTNGDGAVDGRDLLRLARFIAGQDVQIDEKAADMNNDGQVDGRDLLRLAKLLAEN